MKNDRIYITHILESIAKIKKYLGKNTFEEFSNNDLLIDGVVR